MIHMLIDGHKRSFPKGTTGLAIAQQIGVSMDILAVQVNQEVYDLTRAIEIDATLHFLRWEDDAGKQLFWHSSAHLLAAALEQLYPDVKFGIGPPIAQGFYYDVDLGAHTPDALDLGAIEKTIITLAQRKDPFIRRAVSKQEAVTFFTKKEDPYKLELLEGLVDGTITLYQQGDFIDLCKGAHLPHTGWVKAVKILNVSGAYWRGNEKNKQLTRIYGITFPTKKELADFLHVREEAKKRSHTKIGKALGLFTFSEKVGLGLPLWLPKGALLCDTLVQFLKKEQLNRGYQPVITPHIGHKNLYITSGHYEKYQEDCFQPIRTGEAEEEYLLKPMNCPHHCEIYNSAPRSYKELPIRLAEFGTVYRYELHGALHGLTRTRCFTQDDAHIFCRSDQVPEEFAKVIDLVLYIFGLLGFKDYIAQLSFRDPTSDKYIGQSTDWDLAEAAIQTIAQEKGLQTTTVLGEAAFYGPKVDFMVKDVLGRSWQLGTVQLDYQLPIRFDLTYMGADGRKHRPVMIHRAPFGSLERFIAILIEHTGGKFPLWLAPEQVALLSLSDKYNDYAAAVEQKLLDKGIRTTLDIRNETIGKKIRETTLRKVPYIIVVGEKEMASETVAVRRQDGQVSMRLDDFIQQICAEIATNRCI
ncbi:MAG: threonine--tRNA ligase [Candidatus Cardinium sp.]|uniref:threonine--tRNA ligase n=1 Tax=Cardinium endosymbiont of Dermatophagoides farinae TaxID=2597823 RepID=UPI0011842557|nr:threonine--tRNA ligase [Cardinium endosymbiont of Dermatophagoides farinae]TSJ80996.1 threonine--tRNA ligase [Cardinium endosymbiont of Dermatophagoides farinae]UWW97022.1 MAG: threonine--tRNA ligase [Candidatus Cardinium sp.]